MGEVGRAACAGLFLGVMQMSARVTCLSNTLKQKREQTWEEGRGGGHTCVLLGMLQSRMRGETEGAHTANYIILVCVLQWTL